MNLIAAFLNCRKGTTAIEYGVLSSLLGLALLTAGSLLGQTLQSHFDTIGGSLQPMEVGAAECDRSQDTFDLCR